LSSRQGAKHDGCNERLQEIAIVDWHLPLVFETKRPLHVLRTINPPRLKKLPVGHIRWKGYRKALSYLIKRQKPQKGKQAIGKGNWRERRGN
jgi:hypothetical protein